MKKITLLLITVISIIFTTSAFASPFAHDGFFFNYSLGLGKGKFESNIGKDQSFEYDGFALENDVKIGGMIYQNLALHLTFTDLVFMGDTKVLVKDEEIDKVAPDDFSLFVIGLGMTYYFNFVDGLFLSGSAGVNQHMVSLAVKNKSYELTDAAGLAFMAQIGKEWWVSQEWGIGISFSFTHTASEETTVKSDEDIKTNTFAVKLSATFN